ncbi:12758_t:CDS:1 [Gigaspora rosea]|nr:12758_t:CDS:1 [Gigaspora rosea]
MKQPSHYYAFSQKATDLHQGLKILNKILKQAIDLQLLVSSQHLINTWNASIVATNKMTGSRILNINIEDIAFGNLKSLITQLKAETKTLWHARNIENNSEQKDKIYFYINRRYFNFTTNTILIIDSILRRHTDPVHLHNIKKAEETITEPAEIKHEIAQHYEHWTQENTSNELLQKD